jgi:hypothetical protein
MGLDIFFEALRKQQDFQWRYPETYEFTYVRDGHEIGSEKILNAHYLDFGGEKLPYEDASLDELRMFSVDEWRAVVSLRGLLYELEREAKHPTEPAPPSKGTPTG